MISRIYIACPIANTFNRLIKERANLTKVVGLKRIRDLNSVIKNDRLLRTQASTVKDQSNIWQLKQTSLQ